MDREEVDYPLLTETCHEFSSAIETLACARSASEYPVNIKIRKHTFFFIEFCKNLPLPLLLLYCKNENQIKIYMRFGRYSFCCRRCLTYWFHRHLLVTNRIIWLKTPDGFKLQASPATWHIEKIDLYKKRKMAASSHESAWCLCVFWCQSGVSKFVNKNILGFWLPTKLSEVFSGLGLIFASEPFRVVQ